MRSMMSKFSACSTGALPKLSTALCRKGSVQQRHLAVSQTLMAYWQDCRGGADLKLKVRTVCLLQL